MKAAFILFCFLLCLSFVYCQDSSTSLLVPLNKYDCFDPDYRNDGKKAKIVLEKSTMWLPRTESEFNFEKQGLYFQESSGEYVGQYNLEMFCSLVERPEPPIYAFTGAYKGTIVNKNGDEIEIETTLIAPLVDGQYNDGDTVLRTTINTGERIDIALGAVVTDLKYYLLKDPNALNCQVVYNSKDARGCISVSDYNPNIVKIPGSNTCVITQGSDPISHENCGPTLTLKKEETTVATIEENISIGSSASATLAIGTSFQLNVGVKAKLGPAEGSVNVEQGSTSARGYSQEYSAQNSRTSATVETLTTEREFTVEHGRRIVEFRDSRVCTSTGRALGCIDTECTYSFKLDYLVTETIVTDRTEISSISC